MLFVQASKHMLDTIFLQVTEEVVQAGVETNLLRPLLEALA
jgi:hypothetical protein